jgi:hypothetical protein
MRRVFVVTWNRTRALIEDLWKQHRILLQMTGTDQSERELLKATSQCSGVDEDF